MCSRCPHGSRSRSTRGARRCCWRSVSEGIALLLASIGLYGVLAYHVGQRTREFGIRMALGSDARGIMRLILSEAAALVILGLIAVSPAPLPYAAQLRRSSLHIGALDPRVMLSAVAILGFTSLLACLGPARRAVRRSTH